MNIDPVFRSRRSNVLATNGMVATSQPLAAQAGLAMLQAGGSAADAAIAAAAMLNVVEPISTGIGGDCFALYYDASTRAVTALNGSGRAPAGASIAELTELGYTKMPAFAGPSVSVPGTVAGWHDLLVRHGRMELATVLQPAIRTAEEGYPVSELIASGWLTQEKKLRRDPDWQSGDLDNGPRQPSGDELLIDGRAPRPGEIMRIPTLAETLRGVAAEGPAYIYQGEFRAEAERTRAALRRLDHAGGYGRPHQHLGRTHHGQLPGGNALRMPAQWPGIGSDHRRQSGRWLRSGGHDEVDRLHTLIECMRIGYADAQQWVCDPRMA